VAKHLLDETAEFKMPTIGRHVGNDDADGLHTTWPMGAGVRTESRGTGRHQADVQAR